jgi:hypothetical protein
MGADEVVCEGHGSTLAESSVDDEAAASWVGGTLAGASWPRRGARGTLVA